MNDHDPKLPRKSLSVEPVHLRLADMCREAILNGTYQGGERFPSERDLADRFEVSRATANKVISTLVAEGLLEVQKGIGTRVREGKTLFASLSGMESFTAHVKAQGLTPTTEVRRFQEFPAAGLPTPIRLGLGLEEEDASVIYLERLRLAEGIPMILEYRWVRQDLAPGLTREEVSASFYGLMEAKFGLTMTGERHSISAVILGFEEARAFGVEEPTAALLVEGTGFVGQEQPLWYQRLFYRGDHYQLHNETRGLSGSGVELRLAQGGQLSA